jgi:hypothetical protein
MGSWSGSVFCDLCHAFSFEVFVLLHYPFNATNDNITRETLNFRSLEGSEYAMNVGTSVI